MPASISPGVLITFEGSEGCGKSTQIKRLASYLKKRGYQVLSLREPGGTPLGERIRHLLKFSKSNQAMSAKAELMLFSASRAQLVQEKILPGLVKGHVVLCDRFTDSTLIYQGIGRKLDRNLILKLNDFVTEKRKPDLTFVLDLDASTGLQRARKRNRRIDRMEKEHRSFYEGVRQGFRKLAKREPRRVKLIDANAPVDEVSDEILAHVNSFLMKKCRK